MEAEHIWQNCRRCVLSALLHCLSTPQLHPHVALHNSFNNFQKLAEVEQYRILKNQCEYLIQSSVNFQIMMGPALDINIHYNTSKSCLNAIIQQTLPHWLTNILPAYISDQCKLGPFTSDEYNQFN